MYQIYFWMTFCVKYSGWYFRLSSGVRNCTYSNRHLSSRYCCLLASKQTAVSAWHMPVAVCTVSNSWWWTERPSEICNAECHSKINLIHWCIQLVLSYKLHESNLSGQLKERPVSPTSLRHGHYLSPTLSSRLNYVQLCKYCVPVTRPTVGATLILYRRTLWQILQHTHGSNNFFIIY